MVAAPGAFNAVRAGLKAADTCLLDGTMTVPEAAPVTPLLVAVATKPKLPSAANDAAPMATDKVCDCPAFNVTLGVARLAITAAGPPSAIAKVPEVCPIFRTVNWNAPPGPTEAGERLTETPVDTRFRIPEALFCTCEFACDVAVTVKLSGPAGVPGAAVRCNCVCWKLLNPGCIA